MNRNILLSSLLASVLLFPAIFWTLSVIPALADPRETEPAYVGVAKYYDNRKSVVTSTHDDLAFNNSAWQNCLSMFTEKKIYHTGAIITNKTRIETEWDFIQYWVDQGYTEAGSHSRNHVHAPYTGTDPYTGRPRISYEWQINGSKNDIIGNLTLPNWWRYGDREYVYAWIEPYGSSDDTVRQWLGDCHYLSDRLVGSGVYGFAGWNPSKGLFNRVGYTVEMGSPPWGGDTSVSSLNGKFDSAYNNGKIYHLTTHPSHVDWSEGSYADQHTDYISNRTDVWYVPFGLLYLYHWVDVRNIVNVTSTGYGLNKVFKLSIGATDHLNYGVSYPITYVFDIPSSWTNGYIYYRYLETDPWVLMENKSSQDFFNGIDASRFDFPSHKAYVSVGFSNVSHETYLQLRPKPYSSHDIGITSLITSKTIIGQDCSLNISTTITNYGANTETFNVTTYINATAIQTKTSTLTSGNSTTIIFIWNMTAVPYGNYIISAQAVLQLDDDPTDNTYVDGWAVVSIVGDVNGDSTVDGGDQIAVGNALWAEPYPGFAWERYNPNADINCDGSIDGGDQIMVGRHLWESWP